MKTFFLALFLGLASLSCVHMTQLAPADKATWLSGLTDFEGRSVTPQHNKDFVILDFWASWCPACKDAMINLTRVSKKYRKHLDVIGISIEDNPKEASYFLDLMKPPFNCYWDPYQELQLKFGVKQIPTTIIINKEGKIVYRQNNFSSTRAEQLETVLEQLIKHVQQ